VGSATSRSIAGGGGDGGADRTEEVRGMPGFGSAQFRACPGDEPSRGDAVVQAVPGVPFCGGRGLRVVVVVQALLQSRA